MYEDDKPARDESADEALLREIRENFDYACDQWREAREARKKDMRYLSGNPWEEEDKRARKDAGRPCLNHDELNQYCNQVVNSARQNKRGVKVEPGGDGATDKTAEFRQNLIRGIEYRSDATAAYLGAFQAEVEGSYGFCRISRRYVAPDSDDMEITVKSIPNPDSVVYDPDCKEPDWRDARWCFVLDPISREEFKRRWPKAKVQDFTSEHMRVAKGWIQERTVLTAEYWRLETSDTGAKTPGGRAIVETKIFQYWTNGVEILERNEELGEEIPIPAFIGQERWIDEGSGPKRKISSLIRLALDPQMSLAHAVSQQTEEAGLTPKVPYMGYVGQFETDAEAWDTVHQVPHGRIEVDISPEGANGQILPLPQRQQFTPNFAAYEVMKDSCRRAVQAAMGISPLPTSAQRENQKSGVALQKIQSEQAVGSYHFADSYDRALRRVGRIMDSWIPYVYDTERDIGIRLADDTHQMVRINTPEPYMDAKGVTHHYPIAAASHHVTISTGPSSDSQRQEADKFLDTLISNLGNIPAPPPALAKLLALAIKMKQLGPLGDQMAEIISPDQAGALPPAAQAAVGQIRGKLQQAMQLIDLMHQEIAKLQQEREAKVLDNQAKVQIEKMRIEADLAKAEIMTKAQSFEERLQFVEDAWKQLHEQAHERGMQAQEHAQQQDLAQQQADAAAAAQQQEAQQEAQPQ